MPEEKIPDSYDRCEQWRSQLEIMVPPCRAEGATPLGGFGGMPPRENFQM